MMTIKEAAKLWNISERRVNELCLKGRLAGAVKDGRSWVIPNNTPKPQDARYKNPSAQYETQPAAFYAESGGLLTYTETHPARYFVNDETSPSYGQVHSGNKPKKPIPIGVSDFKTITTKYQYVDKTMMIKDLIDSGAYISLFTRPRRFGKTLNLDMLRVFFEKSDDDNSVYFRDKAIWRCGPDYTEMQGKYPVIWLSFKDIKDSNSDACLAHIKDLICEEYARHEIDMPDEPLASLIRTLSRKLCTGTNEKTIILIDEYDTPLQSAHAAGYYDEVIDTVRMMLSACLKDNPHLEMGVLTGILEISKESIFSALNNVLSFSIISEKFSEYFGFTEAEVMALAKSCGAGANFSEIKAWYDGYKFGSREIYNPWSVLMYLSENCKAAPYWRNTGNNQILGEMIDYMDANLKRKLITLMQGQSVTGVIDPRLAYADLKKNPYAVFSLLLVSGYLKIDKLEIENGRMFGQLSLPNKELACIFKEEILNRFVDIMPQEYELPLLDAMKSADAGLLEEKLKKFLLDVVSCHDAANEGFYHGLLLGFCAQMCDYYFLSSNKESGYGRYDIQLSPKKSDLPGIIIELKSAKSRAGLEALAKAAVNQIREKEYCTDMASHGIDKILIYGVAFCGKEVIVCTDYENGFLRVTESKGQ